MVFIIAFLPAIVSYGFFYFTFKILAHSRIFKFLYYIFYVLTFIVFLLSVCVYIDIVIESIDTLIFKQLWNADWYNPLFIEDGLD